MTIEEFEKSVKEIETDIIIPLENEELSISIKDLIIRLNDVQVDYVRNDNGEYLTVSKTGLNNVWLIYVLSK